MMLNHFPMMYKTRKPWNDQYNPVNGIAQNHMVLELYKAPIENISFGDNGMTSKDVV